MWSFDLKPPFFYGPGARHDEIVVTAYLGFETVDDWPRHQSPSLAIGFGKKCRIIGFAMNSAAAMPSGPRIVRPPKFCVGDTVSVCHEDSDSPTGISMKQSKVHSFKRVGRVRIDIALKVIRVYVSCVYLRVIFVRRVTCTTYIWTTGREQCTKNF